MRVRDTQLRGRYPGIQMLQAPSRERILSGDRELTQPQLFQNAGRAAAGFTQLGVRAEDTVALMLRNDLPFFEATIGANALSARAVPINWHFLADEAEYVLRDSDAKVLLVHADLFHQVREGIPAGVTTLIVTTPPEVRAAYSLRDRDCVPPEGLTRWDEWLASCEPRALTAAPTPSSMLYTSGTTGHPKGVKREAHTPATTARLAEVVAEVFGLRAGDDFRTVITGPMYHAAPNSYGLWAARNGGLCILQPRFEPEELLQLIERHRITHLHMVPTMFVRLLRLPEETKRQYDLSSLAFVVHAAAPCPTGIKQRMIEWWGPVINEYYGSTETGAVVFHTSDEALRKPGTVGRPVKHGKVRIYDEQGKVLGPNQVGEIYGGIEGFADFTYNGMDQVRRQIERDGLFTVGDVGYLDEDGYLFLCDRRRDMVISGGVNIYPAEIEAILIGMPGVHDCAVFGIPDDEFGEALCAHVEPEPGATIRPDAVRGFLDGKLADYKIPRVVKIQHNLPREDSGKIFKRKLRAPYWENAGRQI